MKLNEPVITVAWLTDNNRVLEAGEALIFGQAKGWSLETPHFKPAG